MLKLLTWKLPSAWVSFVIFLHTPSTQRSHNDRLSHRCHLPEACSPNVNTIFYGAVKKIANRNLLPLQGEPKAAQNPDAFQGQHNRPPFSTPPVAKLSGCRSFQPCKSPPLPTPISHYLNINGKQFTFNERKGAAFDHVP